MDTYGPASPSQREIYRYLLKTWLNARNPTWSAKKRLAQWSPRPATAAPAIVSPTGGRNERA
jgi:hypothetical protein